MKNRWQAQSKLLIMTQIIKYCFDKLKQDRIKTLAVYPLLLLIALCSCNDRTPSATRLEKAADIKLPKDFVVLRDEYQGMIQDYCIIYEIKFENQSAAELTKTITASPFYNPKVKSDKMHVDHLLIQNGKREVWYRSGNGYHFSRQNGRQSYSIDFDTLTRVLKYIEMYD